MDPHDHHGTHDQLGTARERFLAEGKNIPKDDEPILKTGISTYLHEMKEKKLCGFCQHPAFIKVDDSAIMVCMHCFKIISENISSLKAFLGTG